MEFGPGFWTPLIATAVMLLGAVMAYALLRGGRRIVKPKPTVGKVKTYACGEEARPEEVHVESEQFYSPVRRVLKPFYRYIRPAHAGILSSYLLWAVLGFIVILIVVALMLG